MAMSFRRSFLILCSLLVTSCGNQLSDKDDLVQGESKRCPKGGVDAIHLDSLARNLSEQSGVAVDYATTSCSRSSVSCRAVTPDQGRTVEYLFGLIAEELARYPHGFLAGFGPEHIWLVNDLKSEALGREASGIAVYSGRVVYLSIPRDCSDSSFRRTVQHELFHIFDPRIVRDQRWEEAWSKNNPPGFEYVGHRPASHSVPAAGQPTGFASWYARTTAFEDRAETYAHGLVVPYATSIKHRSAIDRYLNAKQTMLKTWVVEAWPELAELLAEIP